MTGHLFNYFLLTCFLAFGFGINKTLAVTANIDESIESQNGNNDYHWEPSQLHRNLEPYYEKSSAHESSISNKNSDFFDKINKNMGNAANVRTGQTGRSSKSSRTGKTSMDGKNTKNIKGGRDSGKKSAPHAAGAGARGLTKGMKMKVTWIGLIVASVVVSLCGMFIIARYICVCRRARMKMMDKSGATDLSPNDGQYLFIPSMDNVGNVSNVDNMDAIDSNTDNNTDNETNIIINERVSHNNVPKVIVSKNSNNSINHYNNYNIYNNYNNSNKKGVSLIDEETLPLAQNIVGNGNSYSTQE